MKGLIVSKPYGNISFAFSSTSLTHSRCSSTVPVERPSGLQLRYSNSAFAIPAWRRSASMMLMKGRTSPNAVMTAA